MKTKNKVQLSSLVFVSDLLTECKKARDAYFRLSCGSSFVYNTIKSSKTNSEKQVIN